MPMAFRAFGGVVSFVFLFVGYLSMEEACASSENQQLPFSLGKEGKEHRLSCLQNSISMPSLSG